MAPSTLPKDSLILITGVNGYIASHCADQALAAGYRVRGTARAASKAKDLEALFTEKYGAGRLEVVEVPEMEVEHAFDKALDGCAAAMHVASVLTFDSDPDKVIPPTVSGALQMLRAAAQTPSVQSVVYTSSTAAVRFPPTTTPTQITSATFNSAADELERAGFPGMEASMEKGMVIYAAAKIRAEQACQDFMRTEKPNFRFNVVAPNFNLGPILLPTQTRSSPGIVNGAWKGNPLALGTMKLFTSGEYYINVVDDARLHLAAAVYSDVSGERLLGMAGLMSWNRVVDEFRKIDPQREIPPRNEDEVKDLSSVDDARSVELLKRFGQAGWVSFEETIRATVEAELGDFTL